MPIFTSVGECISLSALSTVRVQFSAMAEYSKGFSLAGSMFYRSRKTKDQEYSWKSDKKWSGALENAFSFMLIMICLSDQPGLWQRKFSTQLMFKPSCHYVVGLSCELCMMGYKRISPQDGIFSACTPCECSTRTIGDALCDPYTG